MSNKINVLDSIEAVRTNPHMFIGSTTTHQHLIDEVLDNAFDEIRNKHAKHVKLEIGVDDKGSYVAVYDDGRGLPYHQVELPNGKKVDSIVAITTVLFSGSKFEIDPDETYIGMHGVGLVAVNALSKDMEILTVHKKKLLHYVFNDSKLTSRNELDVPPDFKWKTIITFHPNEEYFDSFDVPMGYFARRLLLAKAKYPKCQFEFNDQEIPAYSLEEYVRKVMYFDDDEYLANVSIKLADNKELHAFIGIKPDAETILMGDVNLKPTDGGTHMNLIKNLARKIFQDKLGKKFPKAKRDDFLTGIRVYVSTTLPKGQFDSQTKRVLETNMSEFNNDKLVKRLTRALNNDYIINILIDNLNAKYAKKIVKSTSKKRLSNTNKVKDAIDIPAKILYIVEGESAAGTLSQIRDKHIEGVFPLKGVPINPEKQTMDKLHKNKELTQLVEAIGSAPNYRYEYIKILSDADVHGRLIAAIVSLILWRFFPDKVKDGKVRVCLPPLFGAKKGKKEIMLQTAEEALKYEKQGYKITRFKGLGEMNPEQLDIAIHQGNEYILQPPSQTALRIVTDTEIRKILLNKDEINLDLVFTKAIKVNTF